MLIGSYVKRCSSPLKSHILAIMSDRKIFDRDLASGNIQLRGALDFMVICGDDRKNLYIPEECCPSFLLSEK